MIEIPRIYIAGPFSADTAYDVTCNVRRAEKFILPLARLGVCPVCPHTMYHTFDGTLDYKRWIAITKALLKPCEGILMVPDWRRSKGSVGERKDSEDVSRPIFEAAEWSVLPIDLCEWLDKWNNDHAEE